MALADLDLINRLQDTGTGNSPRAMATGFLTHSLAGACLQTPYDTGCQPTSQLIYGFTGEEATTDSPGLVSIVDSPKKRDWIIFIPTVGPTAPTAPEVARELRRVLDLPIDDIAAMCGVRRRQFYNLLNGETQRPKQERHMLLVRELLSEIEKAVGDDPARTRAAVLMPITEDFASFYDVACAGEDGLLQETGRGLLKRLAEGQTEGMIPRPAPSLRGLRSSEADEIADKTLRTSRTDGDDR